MIIVFFHLYVYSSLVPFVPELYFIVCGCEDT